MRPSLSGGPTKAELRAATQSARERRPLAERRAADAARTELVAEVAARHAVIACYVSNGAEPDTHALLDKLYRRGRRVLVPWLGTGGGLAIGWGRFTGMDSLRPGPRGILQPPEALPGNPLEDASLIVCPALAATPTGDRLGTGGGWYDRALTEASPRIKTLCLVDDAEIHDRLPVDPWDIRMDLVATQTRLHASQPG